MATTAEYTRQSHHNFSEANRVCDTIIKVIGAKNEESTICRAHDENVLVYFLDGNEISVTINILCLGTGKFDMSIKHEGSTDTKSEEDLSLEDLVSIILGEHILWSKRDHEEDSKPMKRDYSHIQQSVQEAKDKLNNMSKLKKEKEVEEDIIIPKELADMERSTGVNPIHAFSDPRQTLNRGTQASMKEGYTLVPEPTMRERFTKNMNYLKK
jgi:hypothetical protein